MQHHSGAIVEETQVQTRLDEVLVSLVAAKVESCREFTIPVVELLAKFFHLGLDVRPSCHSGSGIVEALEKQLRESAKLYEMEKVQSRAGPHVFCPI